MQNIIKHLTLLISIFVVSQLQAQDTLTVAKQDVSKMIEDYKERIKNADFRYWILFIVAFIISYSLVYLGFYWFGTTITNPIFKHTIAIIFGRHLVAASNGVADWEASCAASESTWKWSAPHASHGDGNPHQRRGEMQRRVHGPWGRRER